MLAKHDSLIPVDKNNKIIMSSLIQSLLNSADDHQTKPNMKYIKYEIYEI